jgi:hypothetical protein
MGAPFVLATSLLVEIATLAVVCALFAWAYLAQPSRSDMSALDEALGTVLGGLQQRLEALDDLIDLLPALVPSVNLVNENPLTKILEFISALRESQSDSSSAAVMRDDDGRYLDAASKEETDSTQDSP